MSVYVISAVGTPFVKIGFTSGAASSRMKQIGTCCPHELEVVHEYSTGTEAMERALHDLFGSYRVRNEWFKRTPVFDSALSSVFDRMKNDRTFALLVAACHCARHADNTDFLDEARRRIAALLYTEC